MSGASEPGPLPPSERFRSSEAPRLEQVRSELQRLGYLSHRFERFLLSDALVPRGPWRGLLRLAAKVGAAAGSLVALVNALALAIANRVLESNSGDLLALFAHVALPVFLGTTVGFLAVVFFFRALLRLFPRRGLGMARVGAALGATALGFGAGLWLAAPFLLGLGRGERALAAAALLAVAALIAKLVADGLLAFGIRLTHAVPQERLVPRKWVAITVAVSAAALAAVALLVEPARPPSPPASLPAAAGERVVLLGIDGVLPDELDYELSRGELASFGRMAREGVVARYRRPESDSPAEVWTTIATGRKAVDHGVVAIDGFRPAGVSTTLARTGPWRLWFERVEAPLGLAEHRPLLAGRRRTPTFWELVARGGRPIVAVNWWSTFPAEATSGVVVAHGAYEQLASHSSLAGAIAPREWTTEVEIVFARERDAASSESLGARGERAALAELAPSARVAVGRALESDRFHRALAESLGRDARAFAVYLPALDLIAHDATLGVPRLAELVRRELAADDALAAALTTEDHGATTLVAVFDPGRRGGGEGRVLIWRAGCDADRRPEIALETIAAALLRAAGLPQSLELPAPPSFCPWPDPPGRISTFGERDEAATGRGDDSGYLENLRSLGYL